MTDPVPHSDENDIVQKHDALLARPDASREGSETLAPSLIVVFLVLVFLGAGYLFFNSGGFKPDVFNPKRVSWTGGGSSAAAAPDPMVIGKKVFNTTCAVCHQASGQGVAGQFPPLVESEWVLANSGWHGDNHLVKIVLNGLQGVVSVKGQQYNNAMAPWGATLKDDQIAAVLTYVRNEWGNKAAPITREFVARIREETKDRKDPWTQKELEAIGKVMVDEAAAAPAPEASAPAPQQ